MKVTDDSCTEWFPATVKPAYVGVYQIKTGNTAPLYRYWDGVNWYLGGDSPRKAGRYFKIGGKHQSPWRGLKYKPKQYGTTKR